MQLVYQLAGAGWADARISHNSKYRDMALSYLSDGLGDMAQAALGLVRGAREVSFSFQDEPGQHKWLLSRGEADSLRIRILWFDDTLSQRPQECGDSRRARSPCQSTAPADRLTMTREVMQYFAARFSCNTQVAVLGSGR